MRQSFVEESRNLILCYDSTTNTSQLKEFSPDQRLEMSRDLLKLPGEMNLDERIFVTQERARYFDENGYYTDAYPGSYDFVNYWQDAKRVVYTGMLIDEEHYVTGDTMWYLNFIPIPDKIKKRPAFPTIYDTDIWWFRLLEIAALSGKFTITLKKRQLGFSLKAMAKVAKRLWFEKAFRGKIAAWRETYNTANWEILASYRSFLNENTAWYRGFTPDKTFHWVQVADVEGIKKGLRSSISAVNTNNSPEAVVSGKTDELIIDEAGVNPTLSQSMEFAEPALRQGDIITGEVHIFGAVGKLENSGPLKQYFYSPEAGNFLALPNVWSNVKTGDVGIFIPEYYSYGSFMDEYGNSHVKEAKAHLEAKYEEIEKTKGYQEAKIFRSQSPCTPEDCFAIRTKNIFPTEIIEPHYEWLTKNYHPVPVTLYEMGDKIKHKLGSRFGIVQDYPVKFDSDKNGAVVIDEPPISDTPPYGLYYAACDPIKPINTQKSESLQSIYIYKSAHEIDGELAMDKPVAWYTGRRDDPYDSYEICLNLVKLYNARFAVENDQPVYVEWLINENATKYLMRRSDMPILKEWVPKSQIMEEYGWRTGSGNSRVKEHLLELVVMYCKEVIGTRFNKITGKSENIYGVTRIKDEMLLKEMLNYDGSNADRLIAFGGVLMAARSNTNRGFKVKSNNLKEQSDLRRTAIDNYRNRGGRHNRLGGRRMNSLISNRRRR